MGSEHFVRDAWRTRKRSIRLFSYPAFPLHQILMSDDLPTSNKAHVRRQPPVPLTLVVFVASVVGFMVVVAGLFALLRYLGGR